MNAGDRDNAEAKVAHVAPADTLTPADRYQELFVEVQMSCVFDDSKTFVDCAPRRDPEQILAAYRERNKHDGFELADFVTENFNAPVAPASGYESDPDQSLRSEEHTSELQSLMRISYAVFCLKKNKKQQ